MFYSYFKNVSFQHVINVKYYAQVIFFLHCNSLNSGVHLHYLHLNSDEPHFKCSQMHVAREDCHQHRGRILNAVKVHSKEKTKPNY